MSTSRDLTGSRLGPYHLDKRYEDLDEPGGQLYAAHHVETGRPALVLVPESKDLWVPRSDWSARLTSQSSPPFLATELERPPPPEADALTDVELGFIRMAGGLSSVESREDAHVDFTQPPRPSSSARGEGRLPLWRHVRTGALVAGVMVLGALVLWPRLLGSPVRGEGTNCPPPEESVTWIDSQTATSAIGYPMPEVAFASQMKPPCGGGAYVEIRGGCWFQPAIPGRKEGEPCPKDFAEHEGKCYVPVREKKPEPRSVKH